MTKRRSTRSKRPFNRRSLPAPGEAELRVFSESIRTALADFGSVVAGELGRASRDLANYPEHVQARLLSLMREGWAIDPDQPVLFARVVAGEFGPLSDAGVDAWIATHFESRLDAIYSVISERHPERAALLSDAFEAHRLGLFSLSVPVFLAQADGVISARFKKQLFSKSDNFGLGSELKRMSKGQMSTMWADILNGNAVLTANVKDLPAGFAGLNRHAVLHGADVTYGSKVNSLKSVSTLYMASFLAKAGSRVTLP